MSLDIFGYNIAFFSLCNHWIRQLWAYRELRKQSQDLCIDKSGPESNYIAR